MSCPSSRATCCCSTPTGWPRPASGGQLFGEERIASIIRREPNHDPTTLCKILLEAASDFAASPLTDDVAILAVRRV